MMEKTKYGVCQKLKLFISPRFDLKMENAESVMVILPKDLCDSVFSTFCPMGMENAESH
jgi:hypothetical protein